jgi:hypothetical protein
VAAGGVASGERMTSRKLTSNIIERANVECMGLWVIALSTIVLTKRRRSAVGL